MKLFVYGVVALIMTPAPGIAQIATTAAWPPTVGVRARVISSVLGEGRKEGVIEGIAGDTLQFRGVGAATAATLRPGEITILEVPTATHTARAKWFAIGFAAGAAIGGVVGAASYTPPPPCSDVLTCIVRASVVSSTGRSGAAAAGGVLGALTGGLAGLWWGNRPRETWTAVRVPTR